MTRLTPLTFTNQFHESEPPPKRFKHLNLVCDLLEQDENSTSPVAHCQMVLLVFTYIYHYLCMFAYVYPCLTVFNYVYLCLPLFTCLPMLIRVYLCLRCLLVHVYVSLSRFTRVFLIEVLIIYYVHTVFR